MVIARRPLSDEQFAPLDVAVAVHVIDFQPLRSPAPATVPAEQGDNDRPFLLLPDLTLTPLSPPSLGLRVMPLRRRPPVLRLAVASSALSVRLSPLRRHLGDSHRGPTDIERSRIQERPARARAAGGRANRHPASRPCAAVASCPPELDPRTETPPDPLGLVVGGSVSRATSRNSASPLTSAHNRDYAPSCRAS